MSTPPDDWLPRTRGGGGCSTGSRVSLPRKKFGRAAATRVPVVGARGASGALGVGIKLAKEAALEAYRNEERRTQRAGRRRRRARGLAS
jgi:hypothetical protein